MPRSLARTTLRVLIAALALGGCKSPERRACENQQKIVAETLKSYGKELGEPMAESVAGCVDTLARVREEFRASDPLWSDYLACLTGATTNGQLEECLGPLTQHLARELVKDIGPPAEVDTRATDDGEREPAREPDPAAKRPKSKLY